MSENYFKVECVAEPKEKLAPLLAELQKLERSGAYQGSLLSDWDNPVLTSFALYGNLLLFTLEASSHDMMGKAQVDALHTLGADYIRISAEYTQVGESETICFQAGKKISAKAFPKPILDDAGKAYMFIQDEQDSSLAALIKAGLDPDCIFTGRPLFVHACEHYLEKSIAALLKASVNLSACKPYTREVIYAISALEQQKDRHAVLAGLLAGGADVNEVWLTAEGFYKDPAMTEMLIEAGADINQPFSEEQGSLLFHSAELFDDNPVLLALLERNGALAIAPEVQYDSDRLERLIYNLRGAETLEQLVAAGIDLNTSVGGEPAVVTALAIKPSIALGLILAGADVSQWLEPSYFQGKVLYHLALNDSNRPLDDNEAAATLGIFRVLLERGLNPNLACQAHVYYQSSTCFGYAGSLFLLLINFCCADGNKWSGLRKDLAKLLVAHGADINAPGARVTGLLGAPMLSVQLEPEYVQGFANAGSGSLLYHLEQQTEKSADTQTFMNWVAANGGISQRAHVAVP